MAKIKKNKEAEARALEIMEIDREIRDRQERIRENLKANKEHRKTIEGLKSRKRELKSRGNSSVSWDENTPMIKLIHLSQLHRLKDVFDIWQQFSEEKLGLKTTSRFNFDLDHKKNVIFALEIAWENDIHLFNVSQRQLFKYLAEHSNLGSAASIKKILQRHMSEKRGDIKS